MAKKYPTDEQTTFIMCETVRVEANKKLSFLGTYLDGIIIVDVDPPANLASLAIIFHLNDGEGIFKTSLQLVGPDGKEIKKIPLNDISKEPDVGSAVIVNISPMRFDEYGDFKFVLGLDDQELARTISIRKGPLLPLNI